MAAGVAVRWARSARVVVGERLRDGQAECRHAPGAVDLDRSGEGLLGDLVDEAAEDWGEAPVLGVRADQDVDVVACRRGDLVDRWRGDDVAVHDRVEGHGAGHHLGAPARRVGAREHFGVDLRLRLEQTGDRNLGHGLAGGLHTEHLGQPA